MEEIYFSSFSGENAAVVTQCNHQTLEANREGFRLDGCAAVESACRRLLLLHCALSLSLPLSLAV